MEQSEVKISNNKNKEEEIREQKTEEIHRITVSKAAERALAGIMERVNEGFDGGRVNRTQVANWILLRFEDKLSEADIREIRSEHFDEVSLLESILRKAKETGKVPQEFRGLLQQHLGLDAPAKKASRSRLTKNNINDDMSNILDERENKVNETNRD